MKPHRIPIAALVAGVAALVLVACSAPRQHFPLTRYVPTNRDLAPLGELHLSNTQLRLSALAGEMKLEFVGLMPEAGGTDMAGGEVYRVKNADRFFKANEGRNAWCHAAPQFIVVSSETGAPAWSNEIFLGLLTVEEWSKFTPEEEGFCGGGKYVRSPG
jgi:hypothetical protein